MYLDGVMNWVNCLRRGTKDEVRSNVDPGCVDYKRVGGDAWSDNLPNWLFWALATNKLRHHIYAYMKKLQSIEEERATRNGVSNLIESPHTKPVHDPTENVVQDRPWLKQDVTFVKGSKQFQVNSLLEPNCNCLPGCFIVGLSDGDPVARGQVVHLHRVAQNRPATEETISSLKSLAWEKLEKMNFVVD